VTATGDAHPNRWTILMKEKKRREVMEQIRLETIEELD
jgi:hypothetical protein